jgi:hypothetical protein
MALNGDTLGKAINDALVDAGLAENDSTGAAEQRWKLIAKTIMDHIVANAEISTTVSTTVASGIVVSVAGPTGPLPGSTTATGAGSGSGTGTVK